MIPTLSACRRTRGLLSRSYACSNAFRRGAATSAVESGRGDRLFGKYDPSNTELFVAPASRKRDVIIVGGGHNGLTAAAYLARRGLDVLVLERRHLVGGAAVTEEIIPGFKFSRASYLAGLLRPQIISELELEKYGLKYLSRDPSSFTPTRVDGSHKGKSLILGSDEEANWKSIAQFSKADADNFAKYEDFLGELRDMVNPLLDGAPPKPFEGKWREKLRTLKQIKTLIKVGGQHKEALIPFYELFTGPATQILDRWFESEILKVTLATDAVIGAMCSPSQVGSAYVLLHHVMGEAAGRKGVWAYVEGGMGRISQSLRQSAEQHGAEIAVNATVKRLLMDKGQRANGRVNGVEFADGTQLYADTVLSNCNPHHTFLELAQSAGDDGHFVPESFSKRLQVADYSCGAMKINCAVDKLPNFECLPTPENVHHAPHHRATIHFENSISEMETAYQQAVRGKLPKKPIIEMTIPSSLDPTIAPEGKHVVQLFIQYAPYELHPSEGSWEDPSLKERFADRIFSIIEEHVPGFSQSVIGRDVLSPLDLERIFGLYKGNIFHGSLSLHQLGYARPAPGYSSYRSPIPGLYICGAGAHPGGGVMGAAGRNCAMTVLSDLNIA